MLFFIGGLTFFVVLFVLIKSTTIIAKVTSQSMSPTLETGDQVLAFLYWPHQWLRKGQIVIIEPIGEIPLIKRVVWTKGPLTSYIVKQNILKDLKQHNNFFLVNGDLSLLIGNGDNFGIIPYENLIAIVLFKIPYRRDNSNRIKAVNKYEHHFGLIEDKT